MVYLVLTRSGYDKLILSGNIPPGILWVNGGVLSAEELATLRARGIDVTNFTGRPTDPMDRDAVHGLAMILAEHHPGQCLWIEFVAEPFS